MTSLLFAMLMSFASAKECAYLDYRNCSVEDRGVYRECRECHFHFAATVGLWEFYTGVEYGNDWAKYNYSSGRSHKGGIWYGFPCRVVGKKVAAKLPRCPHNSPIVKKAANPPTLDGWETQTHPAGTN